MKEEKMKEEKMKEVQLKLKFLMSKAEIEYIMNRVKTGADKSKKMLLR